MCFKHGEEPSLNIISNFLTIEAEDQSISSALM